MALHGRVSRAHLVDNHDGKPDDDDDGNSMMIMRIMATLMISVKVHSHGSGVGDCARYGGKGGVGCLTTIINHQTFLNGQNSHFSVWGNYLLITGVPYFAGVP